MHGTHLTEANYWIAVNTLDNTYHLELINELGRGAYGIVVSMRDKVRQKEVAVKLVTKPRRTELTEWPRLLHPNIIPLHNYYRLENGLTAFVMPHMRCNLVALVNNQTFQSRFRGFQQVAKWMSHLLSALNYLHLQHLYHLDVKLGNELISYNLNALLCDFSFLTSNCSVLAKNIGMPDIYRPPEVCLVEESRSNVEEVKFDSQMLDLWGFGILCIEAFTNQALYTNPRRTYDEIHKCPMWKGWNIDVLPFLTSIREDNQYFLSLLQTTYPSSSVTLDDAILCLRFADMFLNSDPELRKPAKEALEHRFLNNWSRQ